MRNEALFLTLLVFLSLSCLQAQRKVLLEHYTSSWCGECPNANLVARQVAADHPGRVVLAYHHSSVDPMANPHSTSWKNELLIPGTPLGVINRTPPDESSPMYAATGQWAALVESQLNEPDYMDLNIQFNPQPEDGPLSFEVSVKLLEALPVAGELRLSVLVVEDSVQSSEPGYQQSNYYNEVEGHPLFGLGGSIQMYPFMNVVRDIIGGTWGSSDALPGALQLGTTYTWSDEFLLAEHWDPRQLRLIAVATLHQGTDIRTRPVLDTRELAIGDRVITSVAAAPSHLSFQAFPNPANDQLYLRFPEGDYQMRLVDFHGRVLHMEKIGGISHQLSTIDLSAGIYLLQLFDESGASGLQQIIVE